MGGLIFWGGGGGASVSETNKIGAVVGQRGWIIGLHTATVKGGSIKLRLKLPGTIRYAGAPTPTTTTGEFEKKRIFMKTEYRMNIFSISKGMWNSRLINDLVNLQQ